jgi:hypothetical protein
MIWLPTRTRTQSIERRSIPARVYGPSRSDLGFAGDPGGPARRGHGRGRTFAVLSEDKGRPVALPVRIVHETPNRGAP